MVKWSDSRFIIIRLGIFIIVPLVLIILPATYFDQGKSICLSVLLLGQECYACGMTRSIMHLIHLDFADAAYYNPIGFIVFPLICYEWAKYFLKDWRLYNKLKNLA